MKNNSKTRFNGGVRKLEMRENGGGRERERAEKADGVIKRIREKKIFYF